MKYNPPPGQQDPNAPFVNGIPGIRKGSPIPAEAVEYIQREIVAVIAAAGLEPSNADLTQLLQAIEKMLPDEVDTTEIIRQVQAGGMLVATAFGTADAITAAFVPAITTLVNGMVLRVRASAANATDAPMFTPATDVIAPKIIVKANDRLLVKGDIAGAGHWLALQYDATLDRWVLLNPAQTDKKDDGVPLLSIIWSAFVEPGYLNIAIDNGLLSRAAFPDAWARIQQAIQAGSSAVISESAWQAEKTANGGVCGKYSTGDGSTTFRVPLISQRFVRAIGGNLTSGTAQGDAIRDITGSFRAGDSGGSNTWAPTGAFSLISSAQGYQSGSINFNHTQFKASSVVPTDAENRPVAVAYVPLLKMYGVVTNSGALDLAALANSISGKLDASVFNATDPVVSWWKSSTGDSWYRKYQSGFIQQGGATGAGTTTINLLIPFTTTTYNILATGVYSSTGTTVPNISSSGKTTTGFTLYGSTGAGASYFWQAAGY